MKKLAALAGFPGRRRSSGGFLSRFAIAIGPVLMLPSSLVFPATPGTRFARVTPPEDVHVLACIGEPSRLVRSSNAARERASQGAARTGLCRPDAAVQSDGPARIAGPGPLEAGRGRADEPDAHDRGEPSTAEWLPVERSRYCMGTIATVSIEEMERALPRREEPRGTAVLSGAREWGGRAKGLRSPERPTELATGVAMLDR